MIHRYHQEPYDEIIQTNHTLLTYLEQEQLVLEGDIYEEYLLQPISAKEEKIILQKLV